jgi:hypothetical protein
MVAREPIQRPLQPDGVVHEARSHWLSWTDVSSSLLLVGNLRGYIARRAIGDRWMHGGLQPDGTHGTSPDRTGIEEHLWR